MTQTTAEKKTSLFDMHLQCKGKMVNFHGWSLPIHYGSQLQEHHVVRNKVGIFDVSHMSITDILGRDSYKYLRWLLANDVAKLAQPDTALYSVMLNEEGGILDDLLVYFLDKNHYRIIANCSTQEQNIKWMTQQAKGFDIELQPISALSILALQGPDSALCAERLVGKDVAALPVFCGKRIDDIYVSRTGYTGEDGFELVMPSSMVPVFWEKSIHAGIQPCGLGARDTLRLEAGMNLYGNDMDQSVGPFSSNLGWSVALTSDDRDFCGRSVMERQRAKMNNILVGVILQKGGILRRNQQIYTDDGSQGIITSGAFSPTLQHSVALARIPIALTQHKHQRVYVKIRTHTLAVEIGTPRFVRKGRVIFKKLEHAF